MHTSSIRLSILALSAAVVLSSTAAQAAPQLEYRGDMPLLVDKYLEIKDPQQLVGPPVELKEGYVLRAQPSGDITEGIPRPDPELEEIQIGQ
jgi:hypothetical protein